MVIIFTLNGNLQYKKKKKEEEEEEEEGLVK